MAAVTAPLSPALRSRRPVFGRVTALAGPGDDAALAHAALLAKANGTEAFVLPEWDQRPIPYAASHRENPPGENGATEIRAAEVTVLAPEPHRVAELLGSPVGTSLFARGPARPYRRILVAADMSPGSRRALRLAARLGALFGAEVIVQHAVSSTRDEASARAALARFLPRELARLAPRLLVEHGRPWVTAVKAVERCRADLLVFPAGADDARRIVRRAACPVLVA